MCCCGSGRLFVYGVVWRVGVRVCVRVRGKCNAR